MKTTLLTSIISMILVFNCPLMGQKVITHEDFGLDGDSIGISSSTDFSIDFDTTGAGVNWDFSDLEDNEQLFEIYYDIASGGPIINFQFGGFAPPKYQASFYQPYDGLPLDQIGGFLPVNIESINRMVKVSNDKVNMVGYSFKVDGNQVGFQSDTIETLYELPFQYGDSSSSRGYTNMDFNPFYDAQFIQYRQTESVVDGYGKLITPYDTYDSVVRVHHTINEQDSLHIMVGGFSQWIPYNRTINEYEWWASEKKRPVLKIETDGVGVDETPTRVTYLNNQIASLNENKIETAIYPNPTSDLITIKSNENLKTIKIWSLDGKNVFKTKCSGKDITINVVALHSGMYTLQLISEKGQSFKSIVIK